MFAEKLKEIRLENSLSQSSLAAMLGVTQSAVANWERGNRVPDIDTLAVMAEKFSVSIDCLLDKGGTAHSSVATVLPRLEQIENGESVYSDARPVMTNADFVFVQHDGSMTGDGISDGDTVFVIKADRIESGDIALVSVDECIAVRRVYMTDGFLTLMPSCSRFAPEVFAGDGEGRVKILGKVTGVMKPLG